MVGTLWLSMRYAALTVGGATLAAFLYYRQYAAPHASDEDKYDKSRPVNAKSGVMGAQDGKLKSVKDSVSMVKEQNKNMNSKTFYDISESFEGSKRGLSEKGLQGCIGCNFVPTICYWKSKFSHWTSNGYEG